MGELRLFVSYRRDDGAGHAGRLYDALVARLGADQVFLDVSAIEPGVDFVERLDKALGDSDATLVVIGPRWLTARSADDRRRIDDPADYVHREVGAALAGGGRVVPVLVGGARVPEADELPSDLRALVQRQAVTLHDATWHDDVDGLVRRLEGESAQPRGRGRRWLWTAGAVAVLAGAALVAWWAVRNQGAEDNTDAGGTSSVTGCPSLEQLEPVATASVSALEAFDGVFVTVTGAGSRYLADEGEWQVVVRTESDNRTRADGWYQQAVDYGQLLVDRVPVRAVDCFSSLGDRSVDLGQKGVALVGYEIPVDPAGQPLALEVGSTGLIELSDGA